ncbi:hypothetical protein B0A49_03938 [Cryomyces minteri]|uniref:Phosphoglycerate mutase family protein n=1 Tax=Cryomyces minteri TaxID=331657 RepID=A0A4U0XAK9_9PEZI|nr:hypothetical protein B0A49_03938 [Cryomyces minteri]
MVLEVIYVYRSNWVVDPATGEYTATVRTPTGIPSDPALASYGVDQARQLADRITSLSPPVDIIYSSPFYRCLQTLEPAVKKLAVKNPDIKVRVENGLGEFYGLARFDHPSPATLDVLHTHFPTLHATYKPLFVPSTNGESIPTLHDRIAYTLHNIISTLDEDPSGPKALLLCTHAASMIAMGRVLTGRMPDDEGEDDFRCFTCSLSKFTRKNSKPSSDTNGTSAAPSDVQKWDSSTPDLIPDVNWRNGMGVAGGWVCETNGDCSFLSGGEERGWNFSMEDPTYLHPKLPTTA